MTHPPHSLGSLLLQAKYRRNCIFSPIALSTDRLCYFKPTPSSRYLGLVCARHGEDVRFRIPRLKWRRKRLHPVDSSVPSIISVRSGRYRFGIQSGQKYLQTLRRTFRSMGNLFCKERRIADVPHLSSSTCRTSWYKENPPGSTLTGSGERVGIFFRQLVHSIRRVSRCFLHLFSSRPSRVLPFFSNWITNRTVKKHKRPALFLCIFPLFINP